MQITSKSHHFPVPGVSLVSVFGQTYPARPLGPVSSPLFPLSTTHSTLFSKTTLMLSQYRTSIFVSMSVFPGMRHFWPGRFQGPHPIPLPRKHIHSLTKLRLKSTLHVETHYHAHLKKFVASHGSRSFISVFIEVLEVPPSTVLANHILTHLSFIEDYSYFYMWTSLAVPFLQGFALKCFMYFSSVYSLCALSNVSTGIYQAKSIHKLHTQNYGFHHFYMFWHVCAIRREFRTPN